MLYKSFFYIFRFANLNFNYGLTKSLRKLSEIFRQEKTPQNFF